MRFGHFTRLSAVLLLVASLPATAQDRSAPAAAGGYMTPPAPISQILDTPPTPAPLVNPRRDRIALLGRANLPPIAELAEPDLKLAGYRINPRNNGPANSRVGWLNALSFQPVGPGAARASPSPPAPASPRRAGRRTDSASPF